MDETKRKEMIEELRKIGVTDEYLAWLKDQETNDFTLRLVELVGILGSKYPKCNVSVGAFHHTTEPPIYRVLVISKTETGTEKDWVSEFIIDSSTWKIEAHTDLKNLIGVLSR